MKKLKKIQLGDYIRETLEKEYPKEVSKVSQDQGGIFNAISLLALKINDIIDYLEEHK